MIKRQFQFIILLLFLMMLPYMQPVAAETKTTSKTWLVAGDSITSDYYCRGYKKYDDYLKYYYNIEQGNAFRFIKTAVPGYKVEDYLNNFEDMIGKYKADIVSIFLGTNNKSDSEEDFTEKYRTLIEKVVPSAENIAVGVPENRKIILFTPIPMNVNGQISKLEQISAGVQTVASEAKAQGYDVTHIDLSTVFDNIAYGFEENLPAFSDYYENDAYHPNQYGHVEIAKAILTGLGVADSTIFSLTPKNINESEKKPNFKFELTRGKKHADYTDIYDKVTNLNNGFLSNITPTDYGSILIAGCTATAGVSDVSGFCQTYPDLIRMHLRNNLGHQNRIIDLSDGGEDARTLSETISSQFDAYPDVKCAVVMPEIPSLYTGDGMEVPTVDEYKQYVKKIIDAAASRNLALMLLTPVASAKRENNLLLEDYSEALIDVAESAYAENSNLKLYVANVFHVLKPIGDVDYLREEYYDEAGFLKDSAHILIYLTAMQETLENLTAMQIFVHSDTTLTSTQTIQYLQTYYKDKVQNHLLQLDLSLYAPKEQKQLSDLAQQYITEIDGGMVEYRIVNSYEAFLRECHAVKTKSDSGVYAYFSAKDGTMYVSSPVDKTESIVIAVFSDDILKDSFLIKNISLKKGELYEFQTGLTISEQDEIKIIESCDFEKGSFSPKTRVIVSFDQNPASYTMLLNGGKTKAFTLSYDDALLSDERLVNMLDRCGVKGTFNVISGKLGGVQSGHSLIEMNDLKRVYQGHEVNMHGYTHLPLRDENITEDNIQSEITKDRQRITALTGIEPVGYAYPGGAGWDNAFVLEKLRQNNVLYARPVATTGNFTLPNDFLAWKMTCHHNNALNFVDTFLEDSEDIKVFSVWGHTYEFNESTPKSWNIMEELLLKVSQQDDVWYATNREIAEYTLDFRMLQLIGQSEAVFNPTDRELYLNANGKIVLVKPNAITPLNYTETISDQSLTEKQTDVIERLLYNCVTVNIEPDCNINITSTLPICTDIVIASFDDDNKMNGCSIQEDVNLADNTPYTIDITNIVFDKTKRIKVFFVDDIMTLKPVTEAVQISIK